MQTRGIIDLYLPGKIALHVKILLGSIFFALLIALLSGQGNPFNRQLLLMLFLIFVQLEVFMWLGYRFFNQEFIKSEKGYTRKIIQRLLLFYLVVLILAAIIFILVQILWYLINDINLEDLPDHLIRMELKSWIRYAIVGFLIGGLIFFYLQWQNALKNEQKLREEKLVFQYETIKNQVNPHFLFNSLNTLSSLIPNNPPAEEFINKLSKIYRYVLENRNVELVGLDHEIEFAKDYVSLQKIRDEEKVNIEILAIDAKKYRILPISLQILIENALKHNLATRDNPLRIVIYPENDYIVVKNNLQKKQSIEEFPGTGLRNLSERLKLITNKEIKVIETKEEFIVKIPLMPA